MRHLLLVTVVGVAPSLGALPENSESPRTSSERRTCDTVYVGPPGGSLYNPLNWTDGLPRPGDVACFPDDQRSRVGSMNPPDIARLVSAGVEVRMIPSTRDQTGGSDDPPYGPDRDDQSSSPPLKRWATPPNPAPPTATGSCCLGSTCIQTDAFDCRELGGYFLEGVGPCTGFVCATGSCCKNGAECVDDDGGGGPMDQELCGIMGGNYLGGAQCDNDPCQGFRIPQGYEIIEVTPGMENVRRRHPRINNCGQIVVQIGTETSSWEAEIYLYDNGVLTQVTNDGLANVFPDINDKGTIVWDRRIDPETRQVVILRDGEIAPLGSGSDPHSPRINNLDHVVWALHSGGGCPLSVYKCDIYFYDGNTIIEVFDDGFSNQSPVINDYDQMAWTRYSFPCSGSEGWTSDIMMYSSGNATVLPTVLTQMQAPQINNLGQVVWSGVLPSGDAAGVEFWDGINDPLLLDTGYATGPDINDRGHIAYMSGGQAPLERIGQVWVFRDGVYYQISADPQFKNGRQDINNYGELAWWWCDGGSLVPSGTRFMRRVRNGDVDFDGDRDLDDFIPMPDCWTGPVPTDGLCECRFLDIDHDRDIDYDDFDLFMRVYTGPLEDCNQNEIIDLYDLIDGPSTDCNLNGIPDECDIESGFSQDIDGDGVPDECIAPIPAVSEWGLVTLTLLLLLAGSILITRRRPARA